jgi:hypothetical protein
MGLLARRAERKMTDPVRGVFRVTGFYDKNPHGTPPRTRVTGVITAPGVPPTVAECKADQRGRWAGASELPVLVDRADPTRFEVLWNELPPPNWRQQERDRAEAEAERLQSAVDAVSVVLPSQEPTGDLPPQAYGAPSPQAPYGGPAPQQFEVYNAPGRPVPGTPGGGLTPDQAAVMVSSGAGERAKAVVIAAHEVQLPAGMAGAPPAGLVDITLDITRADGTSYSTVTRVGFSTAERRARVATVGAQLPVFIDPGSQDRVAIDTASLFG